MGYTIDECMGILENIQTKLDSMAAVRDGLESRRDEIQQRLAYLLSLSIRVAELEMQFEEIDGASLDEVIEMGLDDWQNMRDGIESKLEELRAELGE